MKKVMVFNFKTMQYEEATKEEGKELLSLIGAMNADCTSQHRVRRTVCPVPHPQEDFEFICIQCGERVPAASNASR